MDIPIISNPISQLPLEATENPQDLPLSPQGAEVILGNIIEPEQLVIPVAPNATTMFGPRGACLLSETAHYGYQIQDIIDY